MMDKERIQRLVKKYGQKIKAWLLQGVKEVWSFVSSPIFLKNLGLMLAVSLLFVFLTASWLHCYTHHGETLPVPDFAGLDVDEAQRAAQETSMEIVVRDSVWVENKKGGIVLEQDPAPGDEVKRGRKIYVRVSRNTPDEVSLPELAGVDNFDQYQRLLKKRHLKLKVKERVYHPKYAENTIVYLVYKGKKIEMGDLKGGQIKVPQGSTIEAVVSRKTTDYAEVPDLLCNTLSESRFLVEAVKLKLEVVEDPSVSAPEEAFVWKQEPAAKSRLAFGKSIKVYLTQKMPEQCE